MKILVIAEHDNQKLAPATAHALGAAKALGAAADVLVAGHGCRAVAEQAAKLEGVARVLLADSPALADLTAEALAAHLDARRSVRGHRLASAALGQVRVGAGERRRARLAAAAPALLALQRGRERAGRVGAPRSGRARSARGSCGGA